MTSGIWKLQLYTNYMLPWLVTVLARYLVRGKHVCQHSQSTALMRTAYLLLARAAVVFSCPISSDFQLQPSCRCTSAKKPQRLGKASGSTSEDQRWARPLGGGLLHALLSAGYPFHVWELQHVEIIHVFFTYVIGFMDRYAILRHILKFWRMPYSMSPTG